jgi:hypothetical protein
MAESISAILLVVLGATEVRCRDVDDKRNAPGFHALYFDAEVTRMKLFPKTMTWQDIQGGV